MVQARAQTQADPELTLGATLRRGDRGPDVKRVQEWLWLHDFRLQPDGIFGPATEAEVKRFQTAQERSADGVVTPALFARMVAPMHAALRPLAPRGRSFGALVVAYARQHLRQAPREVEGDNRGPWVRLYMRGNEGAEWPWCAGFVSYCVQQAARALGGKAPLPYTFSCDRLADAAMRAELFVDGSTPGASARVRPGSLFLVRRARNDWQHVGIVTARTTTTFRTVEGNTNDEGSANGHEVAERTRAYAGRDFILLHAAPANLLA